MPLVYSEGFVKRRDVAGAFMVAYMKGVRVYNDAFIKGADKDKVIDIIALHAGIDRTVVEETNPAGLDPNQDINLASLREMQDFFVEQKLMPAPVELTKVVDTGFAKAAVETLGPCK